MRDWSDPRTVAANATERRFIVYAWLLGGEDVKRCAERLKVARQRVHDDVSWLVEIGALRKLSADRARLRVERGEGAPRYERAAMAAMETLSGARGERSGPRGPPLGLSVRAHHWRWSRHFTSGPRIEPPWTHRYEASGVPSFALRIEDGGEGFVVREYRGKRRRSLQVQAPPAVVESGPDVLAAEARMAARVEAVGNAFAARFGYMLLGSWRQSHPTEYAAPPVPGLRPFGTPGEPPAWGDESPGEGQCEPETQNARLAAAWADLPTFERDTLARLDAIEARLGRVEQREARHITITERAVALLEATTEESG